MRSSESKRTETRLAESQSGRPAGNADYNLRILWPLARWIEDQLGAESLAKLAHSVALRPVDLDGSNRWVAADTFERFLAGARELVTSDDDFKRASAYRIREAFGPLRYVLWATSPASVLAQAVTNLRLVTTVEQGELTRLGRTAVEVRFRGSFGRLSCLLRQAQSAALPTMWGLPPAHVHEHACVARGDPCCSWRIDWYEHRRWMPSVLCALAFWGLGWLLVRAGFATVPAPVFLSLLGATLGYVYEGRRAERVNVQTREQVMDALRQLANEEADARREIVDLHQRQKEWTRLVEEQVGDRTRTLERVVSGMQALQEERASTLLGVSHDLRNPLQVLQFGAEVVRMRCRGEPQVTGVLDDMDLAADQMKRMLKDLVETASAQRAPIPFTAQRLEVGALTERLQRRLRALVHGGDVRATVFATREAPAAIDIDPLLLDRIVDNLLGNAAKYTDRGSIVVELDGTPGFLVIKVSDTGRGMDQEQLERCFTPGGSDPKLRAIDSFGIGLSVVVQLLDQIGGRLEVMSKLGEGTTFWVHLPLKVAPAERRVSGNAPDLGAPPPLSRVVRIRRLSA
ncbi:MAG TPA: HAMP domain-containing sensor histidine kinase [Polyangiaceae bacterium]|nr:HAMP domain-containing sensor histidine kinase [Polyangiaceae bacterium]